MIWSNIKLSSFLLMLSFITFMCLILIYIKYLKKNSIDIVIARYNENLDWINKLDLNKFRNIIIYNKGDKESINLNHISNIKIIDLKNVGRCDHTYLYHIINNYNNLADVTVFLPGSANMDYKWKMTNKVINKVLETNDSVFFANNTSIDSLYQFKLDNWKSSSPENVKKNPESKLEPCPERPFGKWYINNFRNIPIEYVVYCGIFAVSREDIHKQDISFYKKIIKYVDYHSNPEAGHYIERSWMSMFYPVKKECIYFN